MQKHTGDKKVGKQVKSKKNEFDNAYKYISNYPKSIKQRKLEDLYDDTQAMALQSFQKDTKEIKQKKGDNYQNLSFLAISKPKKRKKKLDKKAEELWKDLSKVASYGFSEIENRKYEKWNDTDSSSGDECCFIWYLDYGVTVGVEVKYTKGGKVPGDIYIKDVDGVTIKTPTIMIDNAPNIKPETSKRWNDINNEGEE